MNLFMNRPGYGYGRPRLCLAQVTLHRSATMFQPMLHCTPAFPIFPSPGLMLMLSSTPLLVQSRGTAREASKSVECPARTRL